MNYEEHLWRAFRVLPNGRGELYLGAIRARTEEAARAAADERWLAEDPLPHQYPLGTPLRLERT